jgi:hypothetical protein
LLAPAQPALALATTSKAAVVKALCTDFAGA